MKMIKEDGSEKITKAWELKHLSTKAKESTERTKVEAIEMVEKTGVCKFMESLQKKGNPLSNCRKGKVR